VQTGVTLALGAISMNSAEPYVSNTGAPNARSINSRWKPCSFSAPTTIDRGDTARRLISDRASSYSGLVYATITSGRVALSSRTKNASSRDRLRRRTAETRACG